MEILVNDRPSDLRKTLPIRLFNREAPHEELGYGSAWVHPAGVVITAKHVLDGFDAKSQCMVELPNGDLIEVEQDRQYGSEGLDLAVLVAPKAADRIRLEEYEFKALSEVVLENQTLMNVCAYYQTGNRGVEKNSVKLTGTLDRSASEFLQLTVAQEIPHDQSGASGSPVLADGGEVLGFLVTFQPPNVWNVRSFAQVRPHLPEAPLSPSRRLYPTMVEFILQHVRTLASLAVVYVLLWVVIDSTLLWDHHHAWMSAGQALFCGMATLVMLREGLHYSGARRVKLLDESARLKPFAVLAQKSEAQFLQMWGFLLLVWTALYGVRTYFLLCAPRPAVAITLTLCNNLSTVALLALYAIMQFRTTEWAGDSAEAGRDSSEYTGYVLVAFFLVVVASARQTWLASEGNFDGSKMSLVSGLVSGVAMAAWVGRCDSKFVDANPLVIGLFYFYAVIQPLWPYVMGVSAHASALAHRVSEILVIAALLLKMLLVLFVTWLWRSDRLLFYFARIRTFHGDVADGWDSFRRVTASKGLRQRKSTVPLTWGGIAAGALLSGVFIYAGLQWSPAPVAAQIEGSWSASITWDNTDIVKKIARCGDFKYDAARQPESHGNILITRPGLGAPPLMLSAWRFFPYGADETTDPPSGSGSALLHVLPVVVGDPRPEHVEIKLMTQYRVPLPCDKGETSTKAQGPFRLVLKLVDGADQLKGEMQVSKGKDSKDWPKVGTATLSRVQTDSHNAGVPPSDAVPVVAPSVSPSVRSADQSPITTNPTRYILRDRDWALSDKPAHEAGALRYSLAIDWPVDEHDPCATLRVLVSVKDGYQFRTSSWQLVDDAGKQRAVHELAYEAIPNEAWVFPARKPRGEWTLDVEVKGPKPRKGYHPLKGSIERHPCRGGKRP